MTRSILLKVQQRIPLLPEEKEKLLQYIKGLQSPERQDSYAVFFHRYASVLYFDYDILLSHSEEDYSVNFRPLEKDQTLLPVERSGNVVIKYEDDNACKEQGLQAHFERLSRYPFITRIQSYRYFRGKKARQDRFDVAGDDYLRGIFTNKERSIVYHIYLTEKDLQKTQAVCRQLNKDFYGSPMEEIDDE